MRELPGFELEVCGSNRSVRRRWCATALVCAAGAIVLTLPADASAQWTQLSPTQDAGGCWDGPELAYDLGSSVVVLFGSHSGGSCPAVAGDLTFAYDFALGSWNDMAPSVKPPPRGHGAICYDTESDRVIIFSGGQGNYPAPPADTWAYDYDTNGWSDMNPVAPTPAAGMGAMAYDAESDRCILRKAGETWAYDHNANTWTLMSPANDPPFLGGALTYDDKRDRIVAQGGYTGSISVSETWTYDYNSDGWTDLAPAAVPGTSGGVMMLGYDCQSDVLLLYIDDHNTPTPNTTWRYDYGANTWTDVTSSPSPMSHHPGATFVPDQDVLFVHGAGNKDQTWTYQEPLPGVATVCPVPVPSTTGAGAAGASGGAGGGFAAGGSGTGAGASGGAAADPGIASESDAGCGCRLGRGARSTSVAGLALLALVTLSVTRRRRPATTRADSSTTVAT